MAKVIIFGVQDFAQLAHYYLRTDSPHQVVGFTVHQRYLPEGGTFDGLPVFPFETLAARFPPGEVKLFAPMSNQRMNRLRAGVYQEIKSRGYELISYVSSRATVFDNPIGDNCFILEDNTIQPFARIGNNVVLWSGNHIGHHGEIKDHVLFTSHVVMSGHCVIEPYCFLGVNATLRDGITLGEGTCVAMGALITKTTEPWGLYMGAPAKRIKSSDDDDTKGGAPSPPAQGQPPAAGTAPTAAAAAAPPAAIVATAPAVANQTANPIKVSVCLVTYNQERTIGQAIESVLRQRTSFPFELVIGDDASTDATASIVATYAERFPAIIRARLSKINSGTGLGNVLSTFNACTGTYIALLEGDDMWISPDKLELQVVAMDAYPSATLCGTNALVKDERDPGESHIHPDHHLGYLTGVEAILEENFFSTCTLMVRRQGPLEVPPGLAAIWGDWVIKLMFALAGDTIFLPEVTGVYRMTGKGSWSGLDRVRMERDVLKVLRHFHGHIGSAHDRVLHPTIRRQLVRLANACDELGDPAGAAEARQQMLSLAPGPVPTILRQTLDRLPERWRSGMETLEGGFPPRREGPEGSGRSPSPTPTAATPTPPPPATPATPLSAGMSAGASATTTMTTATATTTTTAMPEVTIVPPVEAALAGIVASLQAGEPARALELIGRVQGSGEGGSELEHARAIALAQLGRLGEAIGAASLALARATPSGPKATDTTTEIFRLLLGLVAQAGIRVENHPFVFALAQRIDRDVAIVQKDNFDFSRFPDGPTFQPSLADAANYLAFVLANRDAFERTHARLGDDVSRRLMVELIAFRTLGPEHVKLSTNSGIYWDALSRADTELCTSRDTIVGRFHVPLHLYDLAPMGTPVKMIATSPGTALAFLREQYHLMRPGFDIGARDGDVVIDGGSCWGDTTLYFAHRVGRRGRVLGFEFHPANLEVLRRNLAMNASLAPRVTVVDRALWDVSGQAIPYRAAGSGSNLTPGAGGGDRNSAIATTLTIDDLVAGERLDHVDFIKMDIEGAELPALRGAIKTLRRFRPRLAISAYHRLDDLARIPAFLEELGLGYHYHLDHFTIDLEETVLFAEAAA